MIKPGSIILLDVDGPVADLDTAWLRRLNARDATSWWRDDITHWHWFNEQKAGELLDATIYQEVLPVLGALGGVRAMRKAGLDVVYLTSCAQDTAGPKIKWLRDHGFLLKKGESHPTDVVICRRKNLVHGGVIIDDGEHNLVGHPAQLRLLWSAPWNQHVSCQELGRTCYRVASWRGVLAELGVGTSTSCEK